MSKRQPAIGRHPQGRFRVVIAAVQVAAALEAGDREREDYWLGKLRQPEQKAAA